MTDHGYGSVRDPYCYEGSAVLKNKIGIRDQDLLDSAERQLTSLRFDEVLPRGSFDVQHYCAVHHHLFQDIFSWAGKFRTVRISKGGNVFCYPEYIAAEMASLFGRLHSEVLRQSLKREDFANGAAIFLADLNAIHPYREGNGRTQLAFLAVLSEHVGHPLQLDTFNPQRMLAAMIESFNGDVSALAAEIMGERSGK